MYFIIYHVKPLSAAQDLANIEGAYVSCWVEANSLTKASKIARNEIIGLAKWEIMGMDEAYEIKEEYYTEDSSGLEFYKQALVDKWVLRFHTYPSE